MIWCFVASVVFNCYDTVAYAVKFCCPDMTHKTDLGMVGFVDDSNGQTNNFMHSKTPATTTKTLHKLQNNPQAWSDIWE
jgi:hypothetical protein